ncbi:unnamed protein product [Effrenium voratum]|uniref:Vps72/YL1 N-terminal domain-containing protein n=1 Tax=Effrenium voratum TaxID=2562239 RepID=A0AA36IXU7_9DINO|nr:unnamed protein product [Effrenium voratum]
MCPFTSPESESESGGDEAEGGESEVDSQVSDPSVDADSLPPVNIHERPTRQTRGRRWTVLDGKDKVDDEDFWGRADFEDASSDSEFRAEDSDEETEDSDLSRAKDSESEEEAEMPAEEGNKRAAKMKAPFPVVRPRVPAPAPKAPRAPRAPRVVRVMPPSDRTLRQSTLEQRRERPDDKAAKSGVQQAWAVRRFGEDMSVRTQP